MAKRIPPLVLLASCTAVVFYILAVDSIRQVCLFLFPLGGLFVLSLCSSLSFIPSAGLNVRAFLRPLLRYSRTIGLACLLATIAALAAVPRFNPGQKAVAVRTIEGVLIDDPRSLEGGSIMARMRVDSTTGMDGTRTSSRGSITVFLDGGEDYQYVPFEDLPRGTMLRLNGKITKSERGDFFAAGSFRILSRPRGLALIRHQVRRGITRTLGSRPWGGMALALLLGWRDGLEEGQALLFRTAGASHVLALSGMHLAVLSALLLLLLKRPLGLLASGLVSLAVLSLYLYLAGAQSSLVRALLMYAITFYALTRALPAPSILVLSLSFLLQLLANPVSALTPAFVLSYFALTGILVLANPVSDILPALLPPAVRAPLAASLGAFLCALPAQALFFKTAYPVGILSSIPLAPLAGMMMILGMLWLFLNCIFPPLATPVDILANICNRFMTSIAENASKAPGIALPDFPFVLIFTLCTVSAILLLNNFIGQRRRARVLAA